MEDVIVGKGQGLIMLLSGPPGTGKTLMAEAIADRTHRPLFYLQAEDLGINAASLGANIKRVFEMATEWNAVILLDEADVFMADRNPNDIHRNELVSIFLRELEYFRGIIFLTTNLYHTIDTAFRSRVSLHLLFQSLSREARETVWRKFLQRLPENNRFTDVTDESSTTPQNASTNENGEDEISTSYDDKPLDDEDMKELSLWQLNGREIKTVVKMVRSWCNHKGYIMTLSRLENGIKVTTPHANKDGDVDKDLYE
jgi:SpoVK/Ycf46/Vps4 family AAA+-type ATPase